MQPESPKLVCFLEDGDNTCQVSLSRDDCLTIAKILILAFVLHKRLLHASFVKALDKGKPMGEGMLQSPRSSVFVVLTVGFVMLLILNGLGFYAYFTEDTTKELTQSERVNGHTEIGVLLARTMLAYQLYNTISILSVPFLGGLEFMLHHAFTILVALLALRPLFNSYGWFFFGVGEFSSLCLQLHEIFDTIPGFESRHPILYHSSGLLFGITFYIIRVVMWLLLMIRFWQDNIWAIQTTPITTPHPRFNLWIFLVGSILLTLLQLTWAVKIAKIGRAFFGQMLKGGGADQRSDETSSTSKQIPAKDTGKYSGEKKNKEN